MTHLTPLSLVPDACDTLIMIGSRADTSRLLGQLTAFFGAEISFHAPSFAGEQFRMPAAPSQDGSLLVLDRMDDWDLSAPGALENLRALLQSGQPLCPVVLPGFDLSPFMARPYRNVVSLTVGIPPGRLVLTGKSLRVERDWPGDIAGV